MSKIETSINVLFHSKKVLFYIFRSKTFSLVIKEKDHIFVLMDVITLQYCISSVKFLIIFLLRNLDIPSILFNSNLTAFLENIKILSFSEFFFFNFIPSAKVKMQNANIFRSNWKISIGKQTNQNLMQKFKNAQVLLNF